MQSSVVTSSLMPVEDDHDIIIPKRSAITKNNIYPSNLISIIGLGCSSFSTFFWTSNNNSNNDDDGEKLTVDNIQKTNPIVQEWIRTIHYAIRIGINVLDTAPWYGHGISEVVIGWALEEEIEDNTTNTRINREKITINTKVGRYEADPVKQFDYTANMTKQSIHRSIERMKCKYIDVLQLHDPEFSTSIDILFEETIPTMVQCQKDGLCRGLGMTGYPLSIQHLILEKSIKIYKTNIWDQSLTYGHYNLHNQSLFNNPIIANNKLSSSFAEYCNENNILLLAAAPLSMGLLTKQGPPKWHPACDELKIACYDATTICNNNNVDIATLALLYALSNPSIPCTILGMANIEQVNAVKDIAMRFHNKLDVSSSTTAMSEQNLILKQILNENEAKVLKQLLNPDNGPFANVWKNGTYQWDGIQEVRNFWKQLPNYEHIIEWQEENT